MSRKATQQKRIDRLEKQAGICNCGPIFNFYSSDAEKKVNDERPKLKCEIPGHPGPTYIDFGIYLGTCDCGTCPACLGTPMTAAELAETREHLANRRGLPEADEATHEAVEARSPSPMLGAQPEAQRAPAQASDRFAGLGRPSSWTLGGDQGCRCSHPHRLHDEPPDTRCLVVTVTGPNRGPCSCRSYEPATELGAAAHIPRVVSSDCECGHMMQQHTEYPTTKCAVVMTLGQLGGPCDCAAYRPKAGA